MPEDFLRCMRTPGSEKGIRYLSGNRYMRKCRFPGAKEWLYGEVKKLKPETIRRKNKRG